MFYVHSYLALGLCLSVFMIAIQAKEIWVNFSKRKKRPVPIKAFQSYALIALATTLLWPAVAPLLLYWKWSSRRSDEHRADEERTFAPSREDLVSHFTLDGIEARELIHDPLGGAPRLPFGHLHDAWAKFVSELPAEAELWSYATVWENRWCEQEQHEGYIAVQPGAIGPFFETVNYRLSNQA